MMRDCSKVAHYQVALSGIDLTTFNPTLVTSGPISGGRCQELDPSCFTSTLMTSGPMSGGRYQELDPSCFNSCHASTKHANDTSPLSSKPQRSDTEHSS